MTVAGVLSLVVAPPATPQTSSAQSPQANFPAKVEVVKVDAVVTDKEGNPIEGLTRDDFTIEEDGQPQSIESFEAIVVRRPAKGPPPARPVEPVSSNQEAPSSPERTFVIVFDDLNLTPLRTPPAKAAVKTFLEKGVREGDRVLLVSTGGGAWWSATMEEGRQDVLAQLERLEGRRRVDTEPDYMTDWEALQIHVFRDRQVAARVQRRFKQYGVTPSSDVNREEYRTNFEDPYLLRRASQVYLQALQRNRLTLDLLERVVRALGPAPGRKSVVLVSEGFIRDPTLPEFKQVVEASRRSNAAVYFIDARGLTGMPLVTTAEFGPALQPSDLSAMSLDEPLASQGSESLATDTGGFTVKNTNDLATGIQRISRESEAYYMLGYRPAPTAPDGRFHEIKVKVRRGGARVRARRGYFAPGPEGETAAEAGSDRSGLQSALDSPFSLDGIPLRMTALVFGEQSMGKADVLVATSVDVHDLAFEKKDGRLADELQTLLVVVHRNTGEVHRQDQAVEMTFRPETLEGLEDRGYVIARSFSLAPGVYQARIVVRDRNGGRIGTLVHEFEVPELEGFRTSTPLLTDAMQSAPGGSLHPVLRLDRRYSPESTLYCEYEVYQATPDEKTGMPRVIAGYEIRREDGGLVSRVAPTPIRPSSLGKVSRIVAAPLWEVPPGRYELVLRLRDELAGRDLQVREPFEVRAAKGS